MHTVLDAQYGFNRQKYLGMKLKRNLLKKEQIDWIFFSSLLPETRICFHLSYDVIIAGLSFYGDQSITIAINRQK